MKINSMFQHRQQYLLKQLGTNAIAVIFATKEQPGDFYYLTGFNEPGAIAIFAPNNPEGEYILFSKPKNPQQEQWHGEIIGQAAACKEYGADKAFALDVAMQILPQLIQNREQIYTHFDHSSLIADWIKQSQNQARAGITAPVAIIDVGTITHNMRLHKDQTEIALMRQATQITTQAMRKVMQNCHPGMKEYELTAIIAYEFLNNGAHNAFEPIVASGKNACTLHYEQDQDEILSDDLVLVDIGAEYKYYAADVSRTFPANGRFTPEQRAIYQAVLDAQLAVIAQIRPGVAWFDLQTTATQIITTRLIDLGLLQGELETLLSEAAYKPFYMHHIGHWLGLDAHDVGSYKTKDQWRILEPGIVLTVEPGIYIQADMPNVDAKWWNIGVRIEDDILVTNTGCEVLSTDIPKTITAIEQLMAKA